MNKYSINYDNNKISLFEKFMDDFDVKNYEKFLDDIKKSIDDDETFQSHLCEAYFYIAKLEQEKGYDKLCYDYLTLCLATLKYNFIEYRAAKLEVRNLKRRYHLLKKEQEDASLD